MTEYERIIRTDYERLKRLAFPERYRKASLECYHRNREKYLPNCFINATKYYWKNKVQVLAYRKSWAQKNRERSNAIKKAWDLRNPSYKADRKRKRWATDPTFRLKCNLRSRVNKALKGKCKSETTLKMLGCGVEDLWIYLESKFKTGMTRTNYGTVWHVDHIMPCAIFDLSKPEHIKRCFHFSNLQPLFAEDNHRKGAKVAFGMVPY